MAFVVSIDRIRAWACGEDMAEDHARQYHVVDIAAAPAQQPRILEA